MEVHDIALRDPDLVWPVTHFQTSKLTGSLEKTGPSRTRFTMKLLFFCRACCQPLDHLHPDSTHPEKEPCEVVGHVVVRISWCWMASLLCPKDVIGCCRRTVQYPEEGIGAFPESHALMSCQRALNGPAS